jgi:hypothetical protein
MIKPHKISFTDDIPITGRKLTLGECICINATARIYPVAKPNLDDGRAFYVFPDTNAIPHGTIVKYRVPALGQNQWALDWYFINTNTGVKVGA